MKIKGIYSKMNNLSLLFIVFLFFHISEGKASTERDIRLLQNSNENRIALLIGNANYKEAPLKNPANDAKDMEKLLRAKGFNVTLKINATKKEIETAIRRFGRKLRQGGTGLFYYAGHGIQIQGRNYLIPIGATIESEADVKYEAIDANLILGKMEDAANSLNIVILDACRNNPFARSFRSATQGLAQMDAPTGTVIAYATAPNAVSADGTGRNGLYTKYLLKYINQPGLKVEDIFKRVRVAVVNNTEKKQVPWESSSLIGDFYFTKEDKDSKISPQPKKATSPHKTKQSAESTLAQKTPRQWQGTFLSKEKIIAAFAGKTVEGYHHKKQFSFKRYYAEDGTLIGISIEKGERQDKWEATDYGLCEFKDVSPMDCKLLERDGDVIRKFNINGRNVVTYLKFHEGNQL